MLDVLFGSADRAKLLKVLLLGHEDSLYLRALASRAGVSVSGAHQELKKLVKIGVVTKEARGRQSYYRINGRCPIIPELRSMFIKTVGVVDVMRDALAPLADLIRVSFIFGSFAKDDIRPESDVDLMIIGEAALSEVVEALGPAEQEIGREVNPSVFPPDEFRERVHTREHFITSVLKEPKLFLTGDERELEKLAG